MITMRLMLHRIATISIAAVWLINGLYCKVLSQVPRHEQIVGRILGTTYAHELTVAIGLAEIGMAVWVVSRLWPRLCAIIQIALVLTMNLIEFVVVPDLLLFGRLNALNALLFAGFVYAHAFLFVPKTTRQD